MVENRGRQDKRPIALRIKQVNHLSFRFANDLARSNNIDDVTFMHGWVLKFILDNRGKDVYQKDIEKNFSITKSSVTGVLKQMEAKGYITRENVPSDARLKKLSLTEEGEKACEAMGKTMRQMDTMVDAIFNDEDRARFRELLDKYEQALEEKLQ